MNWIKMDNIVGSAYTTQELALQQNMMFACSQNWTLHTCLGCFSVLLQAWGSWHSLGALSSNEKQKNTAVVCFWSFSTGIISLDMSLIKYDLQSCSTCPFYWAEHWDITSQFELFTVKPFIFLRPYCSFLCELVCSQWPSFVSMWF